MPGAGGTREAKRMATKLNEMRLARNAMWLLLPTLAAALSQSQLRSTKCQTFTTPSAMFERGSRPESWLRGGRKGPVIGLFAAANAKAAAAKAKAADEARSAQARKIARSVDQVVGATMSGFFGPWVLGFLFGTFGGIRSVGIKAAMRNAVGTGNSWGVLSAAFCGMEVFAREVRGKQDKWNNMIGACSAGAVGACGRGPQAMATGCVNFAGMSYLLDLLVSKQHDSFEQYVQDPSKVDSQVEGAVGRRKSKKASS